MEDRWLSVSEISEYLGVVRESVYRWLAKGSMPGHKLGRHWKFRKQEVDEWVRSGGANEQSEAGSSPQMAEQDDAKTQS